MRIQSWQFSDFSSVNFRKVGLFECQYLRSQCRYRHAVKFHVKISDRPFRFNYAHYCGFNNGEIAWLFFRNFTNPRQNSNCRIFWKCGMTLRGYPESHHWGFLWYGEALSSFFNILAVQLSSTRATRGHVKIIIFRLLLSEFGLYLLSQQSQMHELNWLITIWLVFPQKQL